MSPTKRTRRQRALATTIAIPATTTKDHHEAKKQKHRPAVNINAMFDNAKVQRQRKDREHRDVLASKPAGIKKSPAEHTRICEPFSKGRGWDAVTQLIDPDFFINRRKLKEASPELPVYGFAELTAEYLEAQNANLEDVQERNARSIAARRHGLLTSEDDPDEDRPWVPTEADIDALTAQLDELTKPLEDEIMKIQWHQPNGAVTLKSERLGDITEKLQQRIERRNAQIKELERERRKVVKKIDSITADVQGESDASKRADENFNAQKQALQDEIEQVEKSAKAEVEKLKKEERAAAKKLNDKINELWDSIA